MSGQLLNVKSQLFIDLPHRIAFTYINHIGPKRFEQLLHYFKTAEAAWNATEAELEKSGLDARARAELVTERKRINPIDEYKKCQDMGIAVVALADEAYPALLKEIYGPPFILFYRGALLNNNKTLAVVGTRQYSNYGKHIIDVFIPELVRAHMNIVSGLALGIDALAHKKTIETSGYACAVLGCGIEKQNIYPRSNMRLAEDIIMNNGCVLSEHPPGTPPLKPHFPRRNRIISGLSHGVLVVEAPAKSGSLITAQYALEQNRDVYAVPGAITNPVAEGTNKLIQNGASVATCAEDITRTFGIAASAQATILPEPANESERLIFNALTQDAVHIDQLIRAIPLPSHDISSTLTILEMKGMVVHVGAMQYRRAC